MTRQAELERMVDFINSLDQLEGRFTEIVGHLRGLSVNDVLTSEVAVLDSNGQWSKDWNVPYGSVAITNLGTGTVTVAAQPAQGSAQTQGVGIARVRAGIGQVVNLAGRSLTLYGTAGGVINVTVFTKPQPPAWGQAAADDPAGTFGDGTQIIAVGAATLLLAANPSRRLAIIQNVHASATVRLGLSTVTATTGIQSLAAGQTVRLNTTQALYGIRESATSVTVLASEVT